MTSDPVGSHPPQYPPPRMRKLPKKILQGVLAALTLGASIAAFSGDLRAAGILAGAAFVASLVNLAID